MVNNEKQNHTPRVPKVVVNSGRDRSDSHVAANVSAKIAIPLGLFPNPQAETL